MSFHIGRHRRSRSRPYYGIVRRVSNRSGTAAKWYWTIRKYEDNSTACRGSGEGFHSKESAVADMEGFLHTLAGLTVSVYDQ